MVLPCTLYIGVQVAKGQRSAALSSCHFYGSRANGGTRAALARAARERQLECISETGESGNPRCLQGMEPFTVGNLNVQSELVNLSGPGQWLFRMEVKTKSCLSDNDELFHRVNSENGTGKIRLESERPAG